MNQTDFSEVARCSTSTIQAIELERLKLSESLAARIAVETGVDEAWLLKNDLKVPPINPWGRPYTINDYHFAQSDLLVNPDDPFIVSQDLIGVAAHARTILGAAWKTSHRDYRIALRKLLHFLVEMQKEFGFDPEIFNPKENAKALQCVVRDVQAVYTLMDQLARGTYYEDHAKWVAERPLTKNQEEILDKFATKKGS